MPEYGHFRDIHHVRNVTEAKRHLSLCMAQVNQRNCPTPDSIIVDAGEDAANIKTELERWMNEHPRLDHIRVTLPAGISWLGRCWRAVVGRKAAGASAASSVPANVEAACIDIRRNCETPGYVLTPDAVRLR